MKAELAYREAVAERDRLQREHAKLAVAVVPGQPDTTKTQRRKMAREIERLNGLMDELMTAWIAEIKARDATQPTGQGDGHNG